MKYKALILMIILIKFSLNTFSQNVQNCGTDVYWENMIKNHPEVETNNSLINKKIESLILNQKSSDRVYYIPTVFHVVYDNPSINIPDNVLVNALDYLNNKFRKQNNTTSINPFISKLSCRL